MGKSRGLLLRAAAVPGAREQWWGGPSELNVGLDVPPVGTMGDGQLGPRHREAWAQEKREGY